MKTLKRRPASAVALVLASAAALSGIRSQAAGTCESLAEAALPSATIAGATLYRFMVFKNPQWDWKSFDLKTALATSEAPEVQAINAVDANSKAFFARGGKLLMYHGWADPQTPPLNSVDYYTRVRRAAGNAADRSMRPFMVPGMGHCESGEGTDMFDKVAPLAAWVERGSRPERIDATHVKDNVVTKSRPLCPYGTVAQWDGRGDTNAAASFSCGSAEDGGKRGKTNRK